MLKMGFSDAAQTFGFATECVVVPRLAVVFGCTILLQTSVGNESNGNVRTGGVGQNLLSRPSRNESVEDVH